MRPPMPGKSAVTRGNGASGSKAIGFSWKSEASRADRGPRGVMGIIAPWNSPLSPTGARALQPVTAGNGVLWNPSEVPPASAAALLDLFQRAGFPPDLIQSLPATREAGQELA